MGSSTFIFFRLESAVFDKFEVDEEMLTRPTDAPGVVGVVVDVDAVVVVVVVVFPADAAIAAFAAATEPPFNSIILNSFYFFLIRISLLFLEFDFIFDTILLVLLLLNKLKNL